LETIKKSCWKELKFCEVSENPKSSICWKFQLSISLWSKKTPSSIQAGDKLNKPFWFFESALLLLDQFCANLPMSDTFGGLNHFVFMFLTNYKEDPPSKEAWKFSFFHLMNLKNWDFWQTSAGVWWGQKLNGSLQGPRLIAWNTKNPIQGNHWVPLGCRALLGC
jgi:hypothetical protein